MATRFSASLRPARTRILLIALAVAVLLIGGLVMARRASGSTLAKKLWAVVNADGTLARFTNVTASFHLGTGQYEIDFDRHVDNCVYEATIGDPAFGFIGVATRAGNTSGLFVHTRDSSGATNVNDAFHLLVICPSTSHIATGSAW